ncbi:MAG TPA: hypothetical protein VGC45_11245 [Gryllotalpicola sp.]
MAWAVRTVERTENGQSFWYVEHDHGSPAEFRRQLPHPGPYGSQGEAEKVAQQTRDFFDAQP